MKVFVFYGEIYKKESTTIYAVKKFLMHLQQNFPNPIDVFYADLSYYSLKFCNGCTQCFQDGTCPIDNDMDYLKDKILDLDIILIASPVYGNAMSGSVKVFFDRITYWTHVFKLIGKFGISITISSNTGGDSVNDYLKTILEYLGISLIGSVNLRTITQTRATINNILKVEAKKTSKIIKNDQYIFNDEQHQNFKKFQQTYKLGNGFPYEINFWEKNSMLEVSNLNELLDKRRTGDDSIGF